MSFDAIPTAVLVNHLAPFFRFESSVDPARADEIGHDGHRLLRLRKFTPAQRALVLRKMDRVHTVYINEGFRTECSSLGYFHLILEDEVTLPVVYGPGDAFNRIPTPS